MGEVSKESLWFDMIEPETGTVAYQDYGHLNQYAMQVEQELVPLLEPFLFQLATPQVIYQIKQTVDAYFATQWVVNEGVNVVVDLDPETCGIKITALINYGDDEVSECPDFDNVEYDEPEINFEVDFFIDCAMDEALEAALPDTETKETKETSSVEDILFEPVDLEKERTPPKQPVYDDGCYD